MIQRAESHESPPRLVNSGGKISYNYDVEPIERDGQTVYRYKYVEIEPPATRQKVLAAMQPDEIELSEADAAGLEAEKTVIDERLADLAAMSFQQIDSHIDTVYGNLNAAQKTSLRTLYKSVLALIKLRQ